MLMKVTEFYQSCKITVIIIITFLRMNEMKGFNPILFIVQVLLSRNRQA